MPAKSETLRLFYKGTKLSTLQRDDAHHAIISAQGRNLCETSSQTSKAYLLAADVQESTVISHSESVMSTAYSPYGCDNLPPASHVLALYTGQPRLPLAVGYLLGNGHRLYDQRLMRFTRPDGLSPFGKGGLNAYAYCVNDPINKSDPTGQSFIPNIHLLKKLQGGYSYKRLSPRLDSAKPNLSQREYRSLDASLSKRQSKLTKQEGRFADAERSRLAQQQARLQSLVPSEVDGKTRYHAPAKPYAPASSLDLNSRQLTRYLLTHGLPAGSSAPPESRPVLLNGNTLEEVETNVRNAFARSPSSLTQIETDLDALLARLVVLRES